MGVKWDKVTSDRTNISFAGRMNNFSYRKYDVRTAREGNDVFASRNAFLNQGHFYEAQNRTRSL